MKLLIVEDNIELSKNMESYLAKEGNTCETAFTYHQAIDKVISFAYDVVVLDLTLPDGDGLDVLKTLNKQSADVGVLIVSARNSLDDKLNGLNFGADDYITKPFHLSELNARIKAIFRRRNFGNKKVIECKEILIDLDAHEVFVAHNVIELTKKEYELLIFFISNQNRVITKQSIAEHLWGDQADYYDSFDFVYQHIKNLRKKIMTAGGGDYITTIYGMGYKFNTLN
ncbi:MAG: response regulator transcription factor [Cyclobacteriaceae bacterium]|nr:response regulator transcription factor [Cyclobacteriaceae bacterium]